MSSGVHGALAAVGGLGAVVVIDDPDTDTDATIELLDGDAAGEVAVVAADVAGKAVELSAAIWLCLQDA